MCRFLQMGRRLRRGLGQYGEAVGCDEWGGLQTLERHSYYVCSVSFSPDGTKVASGSYNKTIKTWEDPRHREMKVTMLCLRRANRRRRDFGSIAFRSGEKAVQPRHLEKALGVSMKTNKVHRGAHSIAPHRVDPNQK